MKFLADVSNYTEAIIERITLRAVLNVQRLLSAHKKDHSMESAIKFITNYFDAKVDNYFQADRLMFLKLPDKLQGLDDETFEVINEAYVNAFMMGYRLGIRDLDELESMSWIPIPQDEELVEPLTGSSAPKDKEPKGTPPIKDVKDDIPF